MRKKTAAAAIPALPSIPFVTGWLIAAVIALTLAAHIG